MKGVVMRHILRSQQFNRTDIEELFKATDTMRKAFKSSLGRVQFRPRLLGKLMFTIFYEPSTRTRFSFAAAAIHLGMRVVGTDNAREFSSAIKGETLEDTIEVLCQYLPDVIVLRHHEAGAAERAALIGERHGVSIINAGDGKGQHPTQALLDLYTIKQELGRTDDIKVVLGGDLANGRTARSLVYLLSKYKGVRLIFVSPPELRIGGDIKSHLIEHKVRFEEETFLLDALLHAETLGRDIDVVYWTRVQRERMENPGANFGESYRITPEIMSHLKQDAILMHPLPRVDEIAKEVDSDPRAAYFRQAGYGMYVRMALLQEILK
ncbi:MAG: aspartate carbamoyltransferase [bacterium]|nr:aspartate carbamoyltransferase [bacterium]